MFDVENRIIRLKEHSETSPSPSQVDTVKLLQSAFRIPATYGAAERHCG